MTDLRDHSQPCEHEDTRHRYNNIWLCTLWDCPGGEEVDTQDIMDAAQSIWHTEQMEEYNSGLF